MTTRQRAIAVLRANKFIDRDIISLLKLSRCTFYRETETLAELYKQSVSASEDRQRGQQAQAESMRQYVKQTA